MIISKDYKKKKLSNKELDHAAITLSNAFITHENMKNIFSTKENIRKMFRVLLKVINAEGDIFIVEDQEPIGYLTFMELKNGTDITFLKIMRYAFWDAVAFLFSSLRDLGRVFRYLSGYSEKEKVEGRIVHLMQAAIEPEFKGSGVMSSLFEMATDYYKEYDAIVLETSDSSNIGLYEHLGYKIIQQIDSLYIFRKDLKK